MKEEQQEKVNIVCIVLTAKSIQKTYSLVSWLDAGASKL